MLTLGAVAYDAKVVPIWDGFRAWFGRQGLEFDYVLYTNYERQVAALLRGQVDVAWHSPLAWIQTERAARRAGRRARAVAMRDTDRDLRSVVIARSDGPVATVQGLRGRPVGVGAHDSPQATMIPLASLAEAGVEVEAVHHDVLVGKHGDHIGGERDAVKALLAGRVDAACILDANLLGFHRDGTLPSGATRVVHTTGAFDHCNFTVLDEFDDAPFTRLLLGQQFADPDVRPLMEMEGLTRWLPGRTTGYELLNRAVDRFGAPPVDG
jgi:ABC-type phosphate/phosphonate transport system substrate-binding protein